MHFSLSDRPRCVPGQRMRHEAHKFRSVAVECSVTANPDTELSFHWSFNDTVPKYAQKVTVPISAFSWKSKKCAEKNLEKRLLCGKVLTIFNFSSFSPSCLAKLQTLNTVNCCNPRQIKRHFFWLFRTKGTTNYCDIQLSNVLIKPNKNKVKADLFLSQDKGNKSTISWSPDLREEIVRLSCLAVNSVGVQVYVTAKKCSTKNVLFFNKTKYFRLRLKDEAERERELKKTWD